jgi:hypothetical protein
MAVARKRVAIIDIDTGAMKFSIVPAASRATGTAE